MNKKDTIIDSDVLEVPAGLPGRKHPITGLEYWLPGEKEAWIAERRKPTTPQIILDTTLEISSSVPTPFAFERGYVLPFTLVGDQLNNIPVSNVRFDLLYSSLANQINLSLGIDGSNSMLANLNMGANKIINMAPPTIANDAANKQYVDSSIANSGGVFEYNNTNSYVIGSRIWAMVNLSSLPAPYNTYNYLQYYIAIAFVPANIANADPTIDDGTYWINDGIISGVEQSIRSNTCPKGYLIEDGTLNITLYPQLNRLRTVIGGTSQGNLKGLFMRYGSPYGNKVYGNARDDAMGATQNWQIGTHHHNLGVPNNYSGTPGTVGTGLANARTTQDTSGAIVDGNGSVGNDNAPMYGVRLPIIKI